MAVLRDVRVSFLAIILSKEQTSFMWIPRQLKSFAEMLQARLTGIQEAINEQVRATRDASERHHAEQEEGQSRRIAEFHVEEHEAKEASAYRKKGYRQQVLLNRITLFAAGGAFITAVGAVIYAGLTFDSLRELHEQTKIQRESMERAQRGWVGLDGPVGIDDLQTNPFTIGAHYTVKNFGIGPAIKVFAVAACMGCGEGRLHERWKDGL